MKKKNLFSIVLAVIMLVNMMIFPQSVSALEESVPWQEKIDDEVYESPIYENGKRLIYIDRVNIPKETVSKHLLKNYKYSVDVYENQARYEAQIVPAVTARVVAELGEVAAYSTQEQFELTGERISAVDIALSEDYDNYIMAKRSATKDLYIASNESFLEDNIENEEDIVYQGKYTSSFILYATDEEIEKYAKCADVGQIRVFEDEEVETLMHYSDDLLRYDSITGTKSSSYNSGLGYRGTGMKIGVIEVGRFSASNIHLEDIVNDRLFYVTNGSVTPNSAKEQHATVVTSIIVGQPITYSGEVLEGVVPNATVYQTSVRQSSHYASAFEILADRGVTVINCSVGTENPDKEYTSTDQIIDELIDSTGITFIAAAGNYADDEYDGPVEESWNVRSPAMAYNSIAVGGVQAYDLPENTVSLPVWGSSSYRQASYLANKPDICAPGYRINVLYSDGNGNITILDPSGTSFAAPIVAGIAVQIQQAGANIFRTNAGMLKSVLITGAVKDIVSYSGNNTMTNNLGEVSGAGLVNAVNSVDLARSSQWDTSYFIDSGIQSDTSAKYFSAGQKVRVSMVFERSNFDLITSLIQDDLNLYLINSNGQVLQSSTSMVDNVAVIEYTITTSGYYAFRVKSVRVVGDRINYYYSWRII